ncbi:amino acid permease [Dethiosulfovibrio sp. F2B]|nr:amino acid permease [Dethiosulfovibrio faecalis]
MRYWFKRCFFIFVGALGSTIPAILLIAMGFVSVFVFGHQSASVYTVQSMMPQLNVNSFVAISSVLFALGGAETTANFVTEMENPKKDFPRAILIAACLISGLYILGSVAITMILPTSEITASQGILVALSQVASHLGVGTWFIKLVAFGITLSVLGAIILYIGSPIKMLFCSVPKGVFPEKLTESNEHNIPVRAVYLQATIVTIILLAINLLPSVDIIYNVLVTMTALTSLFPYILLFTSYIKLRRTRPDEVRPYVIAKDANTAILIASVVMVVVIGGILLPLAPAMPTLRENVIYEIEIIGGAVVVIFSGLWIWRKFVKRTHCVR